MGSEKHTYGRQFCYRLFVYGAVVAGTMQLLILMTVNGHRDTMFLENGPLEWLQFLLALGAACWLMSVGRKGNPVLSIFGCVTLIAACRELDGLVGNDSYKFVLWPIVAACAVWVFRRHRDVITKDFWRVTATPAWGLMVTGCMTVCVFAQIFGQKELWMELMGDSYQRLVKNAFEESTELFGYLMVAFGAVESTWVAPAISEIAAEVDVDIVPFPGSQATEPVGARSAA